MLNRIHQRLGTAGFIISIVALLAALGGGAYAAKGGLSGKQKKEVEKIAKKFAGVDGASGAVGPKGDPGAPGTAGVNGTNGAPGQKGEEGKQGPRGIAGESVVVVELPAHNGSGHCETGGGVKVVNGTGEAFACNGEGGGGGYPETLPSGRTETGFWEVQGEKGRLVFEGNFAATTISFSLPLAAAPTEAVMIDSDATAEEKAKCPGGFETPSAATAGILCLYASESREVATPLISPQTFGASLLFPKTEEEVGSWAVKAP